MKNYKIERGVPIPEPKKGRPRKYPWLEMDVGDSVLIAKKPNTISGSLGRVHKTHPDRQYAVRAVEGGTRVWRVK